MKGRIVNFEVLRVVAMLLILTLHTYVESGVMGSHFLFKQLIWEHVDLTSRLYSPSPLPCIAAVVFILFAAGIIVDCLRHRLVTLLQLHRITAWLKEKTEAQL